MQSVIESLASIATSLGCDKSRTIGKDDFGALIFRLLVERDLMPADSFIEAMILWQDTPKNASAMRQKLYESDSAKTDDKRSALLEKYRDLA